MSHPETIWCPTCSGSGRTALGQEKQETLDALRVLGEGSAIDLSRQLGTTANAGCPAGGVVLDPFGGSGTVGEVAEQEGRNWILFELSEEYAKLARQRTAQRGLLVEAAR